MKKDPVWFKLFGDFVPFHRLMFFTLFDNEKIFIQPKRKWTDTWMYPYRWPQNQLRQVESLVQVDDPRPRLRFHMMGNRRKNGGFELAS